jgi:hypothetical protein
MVLLQGLELPENPPEQFGADQILYTEDQLTLAWDPPPSDVTGYKVFYRPHSTGAWTLIEEIPATANPEYTLYYSDFGNGEYDFGVVAVDAETSESAMHTSLDDTAQPENGWYLSWIL